MKLCNLYYHSIYIFNEKCNFVEKIEIVMKRRYFVIILFIAFALAACSGGKNDKTDKNPNTPTVNNNLESGKISIGATEESYDLAQRLASNYVAQNTNIIIDVISCKAEDVNQMLTSGQVQLIVSGGNKNPLPNFKSTIIATDLLVLTVNYNNPILQYLVIYGLSLKDINGIFATGQINNWNQIDKKAESVPLKPLAGADNSSLNLIIKDFIKSGFASTTTSVISEYDLISSISINPGAIAFMSHRNAYNYNSGSKTNGLYIIPVDINNNGVADDSELIYDNLNTLKKAYKNGSFPKNLVRYHFFITNEKGERADIVSHFTNFALNNASNIISGAGYLEPKK